MPSLEVLILHRQKQLAKIVINESIKELSTLKAHLEVLLGFTSKAINDYDIQETVRGILENYANKTGPDIF